VIAAGLMLVACTVNVAGGRLPIPKLKPVDILALSTRLGDWNCFRQLPETDAEHIATPNALYHRWLFRKSSGQEVELLLETSTDPQMFHTPTQCMPSQHWDIDPVINTRVQPPAGSNLPSPPANVMRMHTASDQELLLYWYTSERQLDKMQQLIDRLLSGHPSTRMFVRVRVSASGDNYDRATAVAQDFATAALPALTELEQAAQR
jgi:EpsI family protein